MVGVFDLGSNSFILLVVDGWDEIHEEVVVTGAAFLVKDGTFESCEPLKKAFEDMLKSVLKHTKNVHVFGTAVFREAKNGRWCFDEIRGDLPGRILNWEEEARYSYLSVERDPQLSIEDPVVFDLGGGSLEVIWKGGMVSLPLGTKKIGSVTRENFLQKVDLVKSSLPKVGGNAVGIGGTFVTLAAASIGRWDLKAVHGKVLRKEEVLQTLHLILDMSPEEIDSLPYVQPGRGKTLKQGAVITLAILEMFGQIVVSRRGYRYALAWELEGLI